MGAPQRGAALSVAFLLLAANAGSAQGAHRRDDSRSPGSTVHRSAVGKTQIVYRLLPRTPTGTPSPGRSTSPRAPGQRPGLGHLMLYFVDRASGTPLQGRTVRFRIQGPGPARELTAAPMADGFGADVDLRRGEPYRIQTEADLGDRKIWNLFELRLGSPGVTLPGASDLVPPGAGT